jgi:hypothetical protein
MDFNRDFEINGNVVFPERDGISFALHTTKNKTAYAPSYSTSLMGIELNSWGANDKTFTIDSSKNDMKAGLYWDFLALDQEQNSRCYKGSYSYKINSQTDIVAYNDDTGEAIKNYGANQVDGNFSLKWERNDQEGIKGKLTMTMGGTTFTYTDLDAEGIFESKAAASEVYFTLSAWAPMPESY